MPYPSGVTGPKPNSLKAGFPQLDVESTLVPRRLYPGSVKIAGTWIFSCTSFGAVDTGTCPCVASSAKAGRPAWRPAPLGEVEPLAD